jgi:nicotinic acetylcholine receptor
MKNPQAEDKSGSSLNLSNGLELTKIDYHESSSKSLLANVYDDKIKDFVLNDDFGIIGNGRLPLSTASLNRQKHNALYRQQSKINELQTSSSEASVLQQELQNILKEIRCITKKINDDEEDEGEELDWKFAAMVLDKLCLYLFGTLTLITTVMLMRTPNFFKLY